MEKHTVIKAIKAAGFDAMYVDDETGKSLAVFSPTQIKSAIGNSGKFDPVSTDITDSIPTLPATHQVCDRESAATPRPVRRKPR
jgi:hypothetical protein